MSALSTLPTFEEIPLLPRDGCRDEGEFMRLMPLPRDDAELRAVAVKQFVVSERLASGTERDCTYDEFQTMLKELSSVPARTPGGVAWKLASVLDFFSEDDDWVWWRYLPQSALHDAIELERGRAAKS
jgi:hypothetical protein